MLQEDELLSFFDGLSNWGRWGADDELGTLNHITDTERIAAARLVRNGRQVSCSRVISPRHEVDNPEPLLHLMTLSGEFAPQKGYAIARDWIGLNFHGGSVTHLDALNHVFWNGQMYNGRPAALVTARTGGAAGAIDHAREGIVGRGVLLDIPRFRGVDWLEPGEALLPDELEDCARAQETDIRRGDMLLVRTGRELRRSKVGPHNALTEGSAGLHAACLPWLSHHKISVLGADATNDAVPSGYESVPYPIHTVGIVAMGLWLIDNASLDGLAAVCDELNRWEFLLTIAPLRLKNSTGSPVNPIAVF